MISSFLCAFVDACTFEHLGKYLPNLKLDDLLSIVDVEFRMSTHKFVSPIRVFGKLVVCAQVLECAGVYKCTAEGREHLKKFLTEVQNG